MKKIRVVLADDHQVIREGLRLLIDAEPDMKVIAEAGNGNEACRWAMELIPDVVVTDVSMPECNGIEATRRLRQTLPQVRVLALTVHEDKEYLDQLVSAGASGYLLKRAGGDELTRAIRVVSEGGYYLDPALGGKILSLTSGNGDLIERDADSELSERETEVARLLAWGYSNKEIAAKLDLSVKTIETYKVRLQEKLDLRSRTDLVRYALRRGWLKEYD
jgi:DNA-binding NarL/FixJ family response regulator